MVGETGERLREEPDVPLDNLLLLETARGQYVVSCIPGPFSEKS